MKFIESCSGNQKIPFIRRLLKFYTVCEVNMLPPNLDRNFALAMYLFGSVKLTKSANYNRSNSILFVNTVEIYHLKAKDSEIKPYLLLGGNVSNCFTIKKKKIIFFC